MNPILEEISTRATTHPVDWPKLMREHLVSEEAIGKFEKWDKMRGPGKHLSITDDCAGFVEAAKELLNADNNSRLTTFTLLFIINASSIPEFATLSAKQLVSPLTTFFTSKEEDIRCLAFYSLALIAGNSEEIVSDKDAILKLFDYAVHERLLKPSDDGALKELAANLLELVLQKSVYRKLFTPYTLIVIPQLMEFITSGSVQLQYASLLVLWILTFDKQLVKSVPLEFNVIGQLISTAKSGIKEKVVRLSVAVITNFVKLNPRESISVIIAEGSLQNGKILPEKKWKDEELLQDISYLNQTITAAFEHMTTFEEYHSELHAHKLRWSPVHNNKSFWIENIDEFKRNDWHYLKKLIKLILSAKDDVTLAVGCRDLSSVLSEAPESVHVINKMGGKVKVMELIGNKDPEVRYEALRTSQLMLANLLA